MKTIIPLTADTYYAAVAQKLQQAQAGDRAVLIAMTFDPSELPIQHVADALADAAKRGVHTLLVIDAHSFMMNTKDLPTGPVFWKRPIAHTTIPEFRNKFRYLQELQAAGGRYVIINMPGGGLINPYSGRSHIKATVIGNDAYIGGCNLAGSDQTDMMLHLADATFANTLHNLIQRIAAGESTQAALSGHDQTIAIDALTNLLIDSGTPDQSCIFEQAVQLIENAQTHVVMTCQFFPDDRILAYLERALGRGLQVELHYNHPSKHGPLTQLGHRLLLRRARHSRPRALFAHQLPADAPRLHLKLIATDQGAILGSHNYVNAGIRFGTAEIAIIRQDPAFSEQLLNHILPHLSASAR
jgi:cardiolipin synthase A/B